MVTSHGSALSSNPSLPSEASRARSRAKRIIVAPGFDVTAKPGGNAPTILHLIRHRCSTRAHARHAHASTHARMHAHARTCSCAHLCTHMHTRTHTFNGVYVQCMYAHAHLFDFAYENRGVRSASLRVMWTHTSVAEVDRIGWSLQICLDSILLTQAPRDTFMGELVPPISSSCRASPSFGESLRFVVRAK